MKVYEVEIPVIEYRVIEVEAETEAEAVEKAKQEADISDSEIAGEIEITEYVDMAQNSISYEGIRVDFLHNSAHQWGYNIHYSEGIVFEWEHPTKESAVTAAMADIDKQRRKVNA